MPIKKESVQAFLNEVLQELSEINARKKQLEDLIKHLQKAVGGEFVPLGEKFIRTPLPITGARKYKFRRKRSHADQINSILEDAGRAMRFPSEIVASYRERGFPMAKNIADVLRTSIKKRPDLFVLKDGYVDLKKRAA
jgi:hypothetical protein